MTQQEYETQERLEFHRQIAAVESAPLSERSEGRKEFAESMANSPEVVSERIGWLLCGNYGWGSMKVAAEVVANRRMNRHAWLCRTVAALDWNCPADFARKAWLGLTAAQQAKLAKLIEREIRENGRQ